MPGRLETKVYSGRDGAVYRTEGLSGTQYHARTTRKGTPVGRYYATEGAARRWLAKVNPPKPQTTDNRPRPRPHRHGADSGTGGALEEVM
jgi:hypothetical protein